MKIQLHYIFFGKNWIFKIFHFNFGKKNKFKRNFFEVIFSLTPNAPFTVFSYTKRKITRRFDTLEINQFKMASV